MSNDSPPTHEPSSKVKDIFEPLAEAMSREPTVSELEDLEERVIAGASWVMRWCYEHPKHPGKIRRHRRGTPLPTPELAEDWAPHFPVHDGDTFPMVKTSPGSRSVRDESIPEWGWLSPDGHVLPGISLVMNGEQSEVRIEQHSGALTIPLNACPLKLRWRLLAYFMLGMVPPGLAHQRHTHAASYLSSFAIYLIHSGRIRASGEAFKEVGWLAQFAHHDRAEPEIGLEVES